MMRDFLLLLPLLLTASALDDRSLRGKENVEVDAKKLKEQKNKLKQRLAKQTAGKPPMRRRFRKKKSLASVLFPGVAPEEYLDGQEMPVWVDLVDSKKTTVPFQYYDLPGVCDGPSARRSSRMKKSLGSKLLGHDVVPSPYSFNFKVGFPPRLLCTVELNEKDIQKYRMLILRQYRAHMNLDDLPLIMRFNTKKLDYVVSGYPIGFRAPPSYSGLDKMEYFLFNHLKFIVHYREDPNEFDGGRIVGFEVDPVSIKHVMINGHVTKHNVRNDPKTNLLLRAGGPKKSLEVAFTYEVQWRPSETFWSDRWDVYLQGNPDEDVHIYAILNSLMICMFMSAIVVTVMLRTLRKDINAYNDRITIEREEDPLMAVDETGWKLVHGDVFRPPTPFMSMILSVAVGTGAQIGGTLLLVAISALIPGVLNPMNKGKTLSNIITMYVLCGSISGYTSARIYKLCGGKDWKTNTIYTAVGFPGCLVSLFLMLDVCLTFVGAATSVSVWTIISVFLLWVCVSTPLVFVGSYFGFRREKIEVPTKVNQIPRVVPDTSERGIFANVAKAPVSCFFGGLLPFGSICIEMFFIMNALWLSQVYYMAGVLCTVFVVLVATSSQVTVVLCYMQLCVEDHRWWIRSFLNAGSTGGYLFGYAIWFLATKLHLVGVLPIIVYLTYMFMISLTFALFLGSIGFLTCLWFNKTIYGALKVD
mmetsp:Transcript_23725/g.35623  ORF Transcript_23725/g.35623 Transcript_23725/m.35623 type:complete len:699 (-) Transcript_23725:230-2326(-)